MYLLKKLCRKTIFGGILCIYVEKKLKNFNFLGKILTTKGRVTKYKSPLKMTNFFSVTTRVYAAIWIWCATCFAWAPVATPTPLTANAACTALWQTRFGVSCSNSRFCRRRSSVGNPIWNLSGSNQEYFNMNTVKSRFYDVVGKHQMQRIIEI